MIQDISNTTFIIPISIDIFLINNNIGNNKNAYKSKQKDYNLAMEWQKITKKSIRDAIV